MAEPRKAGVFAVSHTGVAVPTDPETELRQLVERSRRIGSDPSLVLYGGGNTSAKGTVTDDLGRAHDVVWVKQSGADLGACSGTDFSALRLADLLPLRGRADMSDDEMAAHVTQAMLDPGTVRPSIETLLHAFLPAVHIDHVHADAVCALTNHAEGERIVGEALGEGFAYLDWMRPSHRLSKIVGELQHYNGVVLAHHGLVTWGDDSGQCLDRTLSAVRMAEAFVAENRIMPGPAGRHDDIPDDELERLLLHVRGAVSSTRRRVVRVDRRLRDVVDRPDLGVIVGAGVSSADHMLTIKPRSCALSGPSVEKARDRVDAYVADYLASFDRNADEIPAGSSPHDPMPRVILVPGLGALTTGADRADAAVAADIAVHTHGVAAAVADAFGAPEPLSEIDTIQFDYWPLELYKLTRRRPARRLAGHVSVVTGAASGIGRGVALALGREGSSVVLADLNPDGLGEVVEAIEALGGPTPVTVQGDQGDAGVVRETVGRAIRDFGGLDGVVLNAGIAVTGTLDVLSLDQWETALRVNLTSALLLTQESMRAFTEQGIGGSLVYIASKNAFSPGAGFGAYSVSKAGMLQLMRIAALEGGALGIRANAINPDAVFDHSRLWDGGIREERAAAHGIDPSQLEAFYAKRNMLRRQVTTADVAAAALYLMTDESACTTGAVIPVDGGVAAAFPR